MKTTITIIAAFFLLMNATFATVRTVSNYMGGAQYTALSTAVTASAVGDTLIVYGSPYAYVVSACTGWNKNLVVYSSGFNVQKQNAWPASFTGDGCNGGSTALIFKLAPSGSGSTFYGITFPNGIRFGDPDGIIQNYTFEDCKINGQFDFTRNNQYSSQTSNNIILKNCIFDGDNAVNIQLGDWSTVTTNLLLTNCIFDGFIYGSNTNGSHTMTVDHCVFLQTTNSPLFYYIYNALIKNCIFMNNTNLQNGSGNIFQYNMARLFAIGVATNYDNTDPSFVSYSPGNLYSSGYNFNVTNATALTGASDGTQIGVNGGTTKFNESGEVLIAPIVRTVIINNTTVAPNGTINVQVSSSKPNDN